MSETQKLPDDAITTGEAGRLIGVSTQTVAKWADDGKIKGWWLGERRVVSRAEVLRMVRPIVPRQNDAPRTEAERQRATAEAKRRFSERRSGRKKQKVG